MAKAIYIFDLGGVLIKLNVARCMHAFEALMGEHHMRAVLGMDPNGEGVQSVSVATKQLMADFERGRITPDAFVDEVLAYCRPGTTAEQVIDAWMAMLDELPQERLDFVDRLRALGHPVYLLSNGNDLHFDHINATYRLDTHFDGLFLSHKMHLSKPEAQIYQEADKTVRAAHAEAEENVIFIDDIEINRRSAAQTVGWKTYAGIDDLVRHQQERLTKRFHKACADYELIEDGDHILIGLSGGKDSLALVEMLGRRSKIYKPRFTVTALHVRVKERDYQTDLSYLESFCREVGVPLIVRDTEIGEDTRSVNPCFLCSWYRRKMLFNVALELGCNKIAFGHHRDDVIETLLMNLIYQGTFATMPPKLQLDKMPLQLIRPLCLIDEADIVTYAAMRGYRKQPKLCPFEHVSSREKVKGLLAQIKSMNPEGIDSLYGALTNIKTDYLPKQ